MINRAILLFSITILPLISTKAQNNPDYAWVIPTNSPSLTLEEKLVRLAWQNYPENRIIEHSQNISEENLHQARWAWLDEIRVQGNLNEFSISPPAGAEDRANFFPRYNVGVTFTPGLIVRIPSNVRKAKEDLKIAEEQINSQKLMVRTLVLSRYQNLLLYKKLLEIDMGTAEKSNSAYAFIEGQFKRGEVSLDEYNAATEDNNAKRRARLSAEAAYLKAKYELEQVIGVPFETVK